MERMWRKEEMERKEKMQRNKWNGEKKEVIRNGSAKCTGSGKGVSEEW